MEYLYSQTSSTLTLTLQDPEEEDRLVEEVSDEDFQDEGFVEDSMEDITVPVLHEDDPCRALQSKPSSLVTSPLASPVPSPPRASPPPPPSPPLAPGSPDDVPSKEAPVRHFHDYFSQISMTFYFTYITINQFIY